MTKVSIIHCETYDREKVMDAVRRSVDLIGGMGSLVKPGMKVLVKPNLLSARPPDDCVDTHPEVARAVVRLVKEAGGTPLVGDSPGGFGKNIDEVYKISGMKDMAREEGVDMVKFTSAKHVDGIPIARYIFDCDLVISVPKFKTHCITVFTAAIKNMYGAVVGLYKAERHSTAPREEDFAKVVAKVFSIAKPHLTIVDSIMAMEGDGPSSGEARKLGLVMASQDAVALDSVLAEMIGLKPLEVAVIKESHALGLGEVDLLKIETVGDDMSLLRPKDFKLPQTMPMRLIPGVFANSIAPLIKFKPYIDSAICARCNLCKITCPVNCIEIEKSYTRIDYKKCVRCLCCHEVCPYRAIRIKRNILTRLVWG
jgi:uncharacterized protein (DUF362 family)/Pyruvate/2-oxoacid:ferredoxin oxidoreductase delta subunit